MSPTRRAVLGGAALCGFSAAALAAEPTALTFCAIFPFSGAEGLLGDESFRGLALAVDGLNAAEGLLKRKVTLLHEDGRDAKRASEIAKAVAGKVAAIFGTATTSVALAASAAAGLANVPYFELTAIGDPITGRGLKYLFRFCPGATAFAASSLDVLTKRILPMLGHAPGGTRIAILNVASGPSASIAAAQATALKKVPVNLVQTLAYPENTLDFGSLVGALRSGRIDVLLHSAHPNDVVLFYRAMQQAHWRPRVVLGCGPAYGLADTRQAIGALLDGALAVDFPPYATNQAVAKGAAALERAYNSRYGSEPRSGLSLAAYTGAGFAFQALAKAGSTDRDKIRAAVLAMNAPCDEGGNGWGAAFRPDGQNQRAWPAVLQWQKGKPIAVYPEAAALAKITVPAASESFGDRAPK